MSSVMALPTPEASGRRTGTVVVIDKECSGAESAALRNKD